MVLRPVLLALLGTATAGSLAAGLLLARGEQASATARDALPVREPVNLDGFAGAEAFVRAAPPAQPEDPAFKDKVLPFLQKYCVDCHKGEKAKGGLALDGYVSEAAARKDRKNWSAIQHTISSGEMPPKASKKPQPTKDEKEFVVEWIASSLTRVNCSPDVPKDPGRVTIRRLNRAEYNNTIRDLCGVDFKPAEEFPSDDVGYGFDNIGDVLSFQPILLEKYLAAAEKILGTALNIPEPPKSAKQTYRPQNILATPRDAKSKDPGVKIVFKSEGQGFLEKFNFSAEGEYLVRFRGWGSNVGGAHPKVTVRVGGEDVKTFTVDGEPGKAKTYEAPVKVRAGEKRVAVAFTNGFEDKNEKKVREFGLELIEIEGPFNPVPPPDSASVRQLLIARPGAGVDARAAAETVLTNFTRRAYRRPVKPDEVARLLKLFDLATKQGEPFHVALKLPMKAVLVSPHFLYRIEDDPKNANDVRTLNDFEFATRLSYFLWSSMPDEELFRLAAKGELRKPATLEAQVKRMLTDPKAKALSENFAGQWLQLRNLKTLSPDKGFFPGWDDQLRNAMVGEVEAFFEYVVRNDRPVLDFLDADYTFVNGRLAEHYGLKDVKGAEFRKVTLPDVRRGGIITMASTLTVTSNPTRTSPVKRGKWILENVLGTPPPPAAPDVPELPPTGQLKGTLREQMEQHRANPSCATCHAKLDPLGFGLENFDGIGGWRALDNKKPVDASGELPGGLKFNGPAELRKVLLGKADQFRTCFAEKLLTFGLGRGLEYYDKCALDEITKASKESGDKFSAMVLAVVKSDPFQKRKGKRSE
ncbi:hypothetical protein GobsT_66530 [Gemmata obscuriglobus]|uniref:DUF1592 domain-containing protein n=1 Tax=Gemmata obscuriglobus TaxID=114 RepID=A0A2Z3GPD5_9BACT|nr:DUF1592 domain-containing protein [Gemmata obscuriglobus]AWM35663.1 DUF1592 domain-containing protein [Gemmata obscuriglobus]QEG31809.1 hypothetical protein GobsT_66530 [Gemmata obscuriglobus]VTS11154.1 protein containing duf1592 : Uncharacterized protein OS=Singulisphaera acidiphila (strain ATCC BAA-1392 / DSM 18658 / VKM B-2454 / MOB10) GN=Sinac_6369 PE=4 SV=1: PSD3: PSD5: PSD4: PSCyt3: PSD2 [Gemmata obscuriglobus UQM 2246]